MTTDVIDDTWKKVTATFENKSFVFTHKDETDHIFATIGKTGDFYEQELLSVLRPLVRPGDWVVDAGANIGNHSIYFAGICGCNVLAFEPNPIAAAILKRNIEINGLGDMIQVHEVALGAQSGSGDVVMPNKHNLGMAAVHAAVGDAGAVKIDRLSSYVGTRTIRLLKIDAEGMDYEVLAGAEEIIAKDRCAVSIEAAMREEYLKVSEMLEKHGYTAAGSYNYTPTHIFIHQREDDLQAVLKRLSRQASLDYIDRANMREAFNRRRKEASAQAQELRTALSQHVKTLPSTLSSVQAIDVRLEEVSKTLERLEGKVFAQMTEIMQALHQLEQSTFSRHAAGMASAKSLSEDLSALVHYTVLSSETDNLREAAHAQEQDLVRSDILPLGRNVIGSR